MYQLFKVFSYQRQRKRLDRDEWNWWQRIRSTTSSYKINELSGCNIYYREYSNKYCNNFVWGQMVMTYQDDHFIMYKNIKSLCCTSETGIIYVSYTLIKNKWIKQSFRICNICKKCERIEHIIRILKNIFRLNL